jgi:hypothetical protein
MPSREDLLKAATLLLPNASDDLLVSVIVERARRPIRAPAAAPPTPGALNSPTRKKPQPKKRAKSDVVKVPPT